MKILLVDDDLNSRRSVGRFLHQLGHDVVECSNARDALTAYTKSQYNMILSDIRMPGMSGIELLKTVQSLPNGWQTDIVLFTGYRDMELSIQALRAGVYDYLLKPMNADELAAITNKVAKRQAERADSKKFDEPFRQSVNISTARPRDKVDQPQIINDKGSLNNIGIFSEIMQKIVNLAAKYHADRTLPVLIEGETGTGKELIARLIHFGSEMKDSTRPFVDINCATLNQNLFESELFGYDPGAFSGSLSKGQKGKLDMANGGTIFLDEIEDLPLELQSKLLRVTQEKEFYRLGGLKKIKVDVCFICATNISLTKKVEQGSFRKDLYFRLKVGHIVIPPLRERSQDILPLAFMFLSELSGKKKKAFRSISDAAAAILTSYHWPGNVRELRNAIDLAVTMYDDTELKPHHLAITDGVLGEFSDNYEKTSETNPINWIDFNLPENRLPFEDYCSNIIKKALIMHNGNKVKTANYLCISRQNLYTWLKKKESSHP